MFLVMIYMSHRSTSGHRSQHDWYHWIFDGSLTWKPHKLHAN